MAFDKIQALAIDTDSAPVRGSVTDDDFVLIRNATSGEFERVKVSSLLSGTTGSIRLSGEADFTDPSTTLTSVVVNGDPDNSTITQGVAPTDPSPIGVAYLAKAASGGTTTEISGTSQVVRTNDQILWSGTGWTVLSLGQAVTSVNGQTGAVVIDSFSWKQITDKPDASDIGAVPMDSTGDNRTAQLHAGSNKNAYMEFTEDNESYGMSVGYKGDGAYPNGNYGFISVRLSGTDKEVVKLPRDGSHFDVRTQLTETGKRVYSPNNKPTTADVGLGSLSTLDNGRLKVASDFGYVNIGPTDSTICQFHTDRSVFEFTKGIISRGDIGLDTINSKFESGTGHVLDNGARVYSPKNKPSPEDIGAPNANAVYTKVDSDDRFSLDGHRHDDLYYRKTESDNKYLAKSDTALNSLALRGRSYEQLVDEIKQDTVPPTRTVNGKELSDDISITKADVGLSQVNNWGASSATNLDSTQTYATSAAVKQAYDRATQALENSGGLSVGPVQLAPFITRLDRDNEWPGKVFWSNKEVGEARQATAGMGSFFSVAKDRNDTLLTGFYRRNNNGYVEVRAYYRRVL